MAITKDGLKSALIAEIDSHYSGGAAPVAPFFYLQTIKDYIEANAVVHYVYTGVTPSGSPDPNNGPAEAQLLLPALPPGAATKAFVVSVVKQANPTGFVAAIMTDALGTVNLKTPHTGVTPTIYTFVSPVDGGMKDQDNYRDAWDPVCDAIVKSFLSLQTPPIPTVTPAGTGTSVFVKIE